MLFDRSNIALPYYIHAVIALGAFVLPVLAWALVAYVLGPTSLMFAIMAVQFWFPVVLAMLVLIFIFQEALEYASYNPVIPAAVLWGIGVIINWPLTATLFDAPMKAGGILLGAFAYAWLCCFIYVWQIRKGIGQE